MPKKLTQEQFIANAVAIHGDKYSYHLANYINTDTHVDIWCNTCNKSFSQTPYKHSKKGQGCRDCQYVKASETYRMPLEEVVHKSKLKHGDSFSYEFTDYKNQDSIINLVCKKHNFSFTQSVHCHLIAVHACPICLNEWQKAKPNAWSHSHWVARGIASKKFIAFQLYVLRCWNDNEEFYKIGKSFTNIDYRFSGKKIPYNYEIIHVLVDDGIIISKKEHYYQKLSKEFKYKPLINFSGINECFSYVDISTII